MSPDPREGLARETNFVGGIKSDDPASVPTIFGHLKSPVKRKAERQLARYDRTSVCKRRRLLASRKAETLNTAMEGNDDLSMVNIGACPQDIHPLPSQPEPGCSHCEQTAEQPSVSLMTDVTMETISRLESECITLREENRKLK